ncbi:MAG: uracil-DNA glycosylase, partial [Gammaproteobacteria bacterium]|nr:uracil-DNA glycosylase [Gammaproteobacteria bacterium]
MDIAVWQPRRDETPPVQTGAPVEAEPAEAVAHEPPPAPRQSTTPADRPVEVEDATPAHRPAIGDVSGDDWTRLETRVAACTSCALCEGRTKSVFGRGDRNADWMIVSEGPGAEEDRQGLPFVGRAGQLLD